MFIQIFFVVLFGLLSYVQASTINPNLVTTPTSLQRYMEDCIMETGAYEGDIKWMKAGRWTKSYPALKRWAFCYLVRVGVMSSAGVLRQHVVLKNIPKEEKYRIEKTIDKCLYKTPHDPIDTAWNYLTCFRNKMPKYAKDANRI